MWRALLGTALVFALWLAWGAAARARAARRPPARPARPRVAYTRARPWPREGVPPPGVAGGYHRPLEIRPQDGAPLPETPLRDEYDA